MRLVISPYELSARSVAAMAALLLGSDDEGVVTLLPAPDAGTGRDAVREAVHRAPAFLQLMDAWRWSQPLWNAGVLTGSIDGRPVIDVIRGVSERLEQTLAAGALRSFLRQEVFRGGHESLHTIARDLVRGGGDPAVSVPVVAGLEALAAEHRIAMVREPLPSMVARLERGSPRTIARLSIPALIGAAGETLMSARERLSPELQALRAELDGLLRGGGEAGRGAQAALDLAADRYERAFASAARELRREAFDQGRFKPAMLLIQAGLVPADESLVAGARALELLSADRHLPEPGATSPKVGTALAVGRPALVRLTVRPTPWDPPAGA